MVFPFKPPFSYGFPTVPRAPGASKRPRLLAERMDSLHCAPFDGRRQDSPSPAAKGVGVRSPGRPMKPNPPMVYIYIKI